MLDLTVEEREELTLSGALAIDAAGQEILVGLTVEESMFLIEHRKRFLAGDRDYDSHKRSIELTIKHEASRLAVLGSKIQKRHKNPTFH